MEAAIPQGDRFRRNEAMKKSLLIGALIAATVAPAAAQAQRWDNDRDRREWRDDRRDVRQDRRDWRQDRRHDQREDWQRWRDSNRNDFRRGNWRAPFRYRSFATGAVMPRNYWGSRYYVNNWNAYRLPNPGGRHLRYVRHYDDVLLVDIRNGRVMRVFRNFYW
jgi:Ni/Co efflux regulator RcnB